MTDDDNDHPKTEKSTMDEPQEEFIGDEARPSVTERELKDEKESPEQ